MISAIQPKFKIQYNVTGFTSLPNNQVHTSTCIRQIFKTTYFRAIWLADEPSNDELKWFLEHLKSI